MRRVVLILLALAVLAPSMAQASAWYRCAHDGETRSSCCCPPKAKHHKTPAAKTELNSACCCKVSQVTSAESSVRAAPPVALDVAPAVIPAVVSVSSIEAPIRIAMIEHAFAPRGPPEPLFVRHCSLLL